MDRWRTNMLIGCVLLGAGAAAAIGWGIQPTERESTPEPPAACPASSPHGVAVVTPQTRKAPRLTATTPRGGLLAPPPPLISQSIADLERSLQQAQSKSQQNAAQLKAFVQEQAPLLESLGVDANLPLESPAQAAPAENLPAPPADDAAEQGKSDEAMRPATAAPSKPHKIADVRPGENADELTITFRDEDVRAALDLIGQAGGLNILPSASVRGTVTATLNNMTAEEALAALLRTTGLVARHEENLIFVGTPADMLQLAQAKDEIVTRLYHPNYVRAADLKTLIEPLLTSGVGAVVVTSPAQNGIAPDDKAAGGDEFAGPELLLVRDFSQVLPRIDQLVAEVDRRPKQVAIEAMILSVKLADNNSLGVDLELLKKDQNLRIVAGAPAADLASIDMSHGGLKVGFLDSGLSSFINALETIGDTNVVASPHLMCLNKQKAEILIGSQLGYVSTTVTQTAATQTVDFLEVGTQLRIRPFIGEDGMIRMEVHPELSTGNVRVEGQFTLPDKEVTQVTTNIMVADGRTIIIGGLIRESLGQNTSRIPWLGTLPGIGPLLSHRRDEIDRQELIVLITPKIVHGDLPRHVADEAVADFMHRQTIIRDKLSPLGTRYSGQRHLRLAKAAAAEGRCEDALHHLHWALHFNPQDREAVRLRLEMLAATGKGREAAFSGVKHPALRPHKAITGPHEASSLLDQELAPRLSPPPSVDAGPPMIESSRRQAE